MLSLESIVPRTEIVALELSDTIENLRNKFVETGLSKILIYEESIDTYYWVCPFFRII